MTIGPYEVHVRINEFFGMPWGLIMAIRKPKKRKR